ncbi:MAG: hypothetical protein ABI134_33875 [Byssovorax sp.]
MSPPHRPPVRPGPAPEDTPRLRFRRGRRFPGAIAWFGARSFWGHIWHLFASVIATEDIDSRDWMGADDPDELTRRVAKELGGDPHATSLSEAMEEDLWIDFVADTGDCSSVSHAVARMIFEDYDVDDPAEPGGRLLLPRGRLLLFGGDVAYPVATELEIHNRVIVPWNKVLKKTQDGKHRVLLGVPGNHDWYAGLDGFGRMFRRRKGSLDRSSRVDTDQIDRAGQLGHFVEWVEAFRVGRFVGKRHVLPLLGYTPVQSASYWALRLAPGLDLWGPDRQLRVVDFQQRTYFAEARDLQGGGVMLVMADPAYAFLEPSTAGQEILRGLDVSLEGDGILVLTGDTHHYCRQHFGEGLHITAGGGGAFLHPARIDREGLPAPAAEFPGPKASLALALQIPFQIAHGRSGILLHVAIALLYSPTFGVDFARGSASPNAAGITSLVAALALFLIGGWRTGKALRIGALAALTGVFLGFLPYGLVALEPVVLRRLGLAPHSTVGLGLIFTTAIYVGTLAFGAFLTALTLLGLELHQAFSALAHPGYKHFVRLRVRKDGSAVDGWVLGRVDPLGARDSVVLVDRFTWQNRRSTAATSTETS